MQSSAVPHIIEADKEVAAMLQIQGRMDIWKDGEVIKTINNVYYFICKSDKTLEVINIENEEVHTTLMLKEDYSWFSMI